MQLTTVLEDKQDLMRFLIGDFLYLQDDLGCQDCSGTFWNEGFTPGWPFVKDSSCFWPCLCLPSDSCHGEGLINMDAFFSRPWCNFKNRKGYFFWRGGARNVQLGYKNWTHSLRQGCYLIFFILYDDTVIYFISATVCVTAMQRNLMGANKKRMKEPYFLYCISFYMESGINNCEHPSMQNICNFFTHKMNKKYTFDMCFCWAAYLHYPRSFPQSLSSE